MLDFKLLDKIGNFTRLVRFSAVSMSIRRLSKNGLQLKICTRRAKGTGLNMKSSLGLTICGIAFAVFTQYALAATVAVEFSATSIESIFPDSTYFDPLGPTDPTGFFAFDDSGLTGVGTEVIDLADFTDGAYTFGTNIFTLADLQGFADSGSITLVDGLFTELEFSNSTVLGGLSVSLAFNSTSNGWSFGENFGPGFAEGGLTAAVNTVPLPAAAWLFVSGLVGLFGVRRTSKGPT